MVEDGATGILEFNDERFPLFDGSAKVSACDEVYHTVHTVLRDNLSVGALLKSDFVVVNGLMADFYGIEAVTVDEFRKVPIPSDSKRGGFLGMAAILAMGSDGERTSPVERGAWVLRKLLHQPAPANVPQLSRLAGSVLSARAGTPRTRRKLNALSVIARSIRSALAWKTSTPSAGGEHRRL